MLFSQKFPKLLIFFHVFSFPFGSLPLFYLPGHVCVLLYDLVCYLFLIECFSLQLLYSSVHFLLICSSFLLKFLLCSSILLPNSVTILITNTLNSLPGKLLFLFHHLNFQRFSLALSIENSSSVFPFYFSFSVSMDLLIGGAATYKPYRRVFMWKCPKQSEWAEGPCWEAGFHVDRSWSFLRVRW